MAERKGTSEEEGRQSSIGTEPRTLNAQEMQHVKGAVEDAFQSSDTQEKAMAALSSSQPPPTAPCSALEDKGEVK